MRSSSSSSSSQSNRFHVATSTTRTTTSAAASSSSLSTNKLKQFLNHKKRIAQIGPPPTQTTSMLQSYLDNDSKNYKKSTIGPTTSSSSSGGGGDNKRNNDKRKLNMMKKTKIDSTKNTIDQKTKKQKVMECQKEEGLWSNINSIGSIMTNKNNNINNNKKNVFSNKHGTLDDLGMDSSKQFNTQSYSGAQKSGLSSSLVSSNSILMKKKKKKIIMEKKQSTIEIEKEEKQLQNDIMNNNENNRNVHKESNISIPSSSSYIIKSSLLSRSTKVKNRSSFLGNRLKSSRNIPSDATNTDALKVDVNPNNDSIVNVDRSPVPQSLSSQGNEVNVELDRNRNNNPELLESIIPPTSSKLSNLTSSSQLQTNQMLSQDNFQPINSQSIIPSINFSSLSSSSTIQSSSISNESHSKQSTTKSKPINNDNFVKLNLRNKAGSCRGARNLRQLNRQKRWKAKRREEYNDRYQHKDEGNHSNNSSSENKPRKQINSIHDAIDPIDDYLDGTFTQESTPIARAKTDKDIAQKKERTLKNPVCFRHNRQCKLLVVKKNTTGNKGRKFYVCSMPKGEQCDFFQWEDDTVESTKSVLLQASSQSGFIARQVAAHIDRFKTLTVPELRIVAKQRNLDTSGKKGALIARLSVWVRDEICKDHNVEPKDDTFDFRECKESDDIISLSEEEDEDDSTDDGESTSSEELEIYNLERSAPSNVAVESDNCHSSDSAKDEEKSSLRQSLVDLFGYSTFRDGQEWAIKRCLAHEKTLLVAPTGMGKSLCYTLPAALMEGICIVVSPLISLIEDQLRHLPPRIPAATISGNISKRNMALIIDDLLNSRLKILFVSPEKITSAAFRRLLRPKYCSETKSYRRQLPSVSLLCLDEAHCLSQWGHNFRSSYLRIRAIINSLDPDSILALTATAGKPVIDDICRTLRINENGKSTEGLIQSNDPSICSVKVLSSNRDNIDVSAVFLQNEEQKLHMLLKLIRESRIAAKSTKIHQENSESHLNEMEGCLSKGSVIIYVWRKKDAEIITEQLQGSGLVGGIVCYHGGMDANSRSKAQSKFMRGKARICVATVAFGLGINKPDVKGVIHMCLPSSPENYLQEIGRAGRDGSKAKAVALVVESEVAQKHSLSFSNRVSESQISTFLDILRHLTQEAVKDIPNVDLERDNVSSLNIAIAIEPIIKSVDMKEETIMTILSMLEDDNAKNNKLMDIQGVIPDLATITLKRRTLEDLASTEIIGRCILNCGRWIDTRSSKMSTKGGTAMQAGFAAYSYGTIEFNVTQCSRLLGPDAEPRNVYAALRRLQSSGELELNLNNQMGRSVFLKMNKEGLHTFSHLSNGDYNDLTQSISEYFSLQDVNQCQKVLEIQHILKRVATVKTVAAEESGGDVEYSDKSITKSPRLAMFQKLIQNYFESNGSETQAKSDDCIRQLDESDPTSIRILTEDVLNLLQYNKISNPLTFYPMQVKFGVDEFLDYTAVLITKILHGIPAPSTPALDWYGHILWGKWKSYSFCSIHDHIVDILKRNNKAG